MTWKPQPAASERGGLPATIVMGAAKIRRAMTRLGILVFGLILFSSTDLWFEDLLVALAFDVLCVALVMCGTLGRLWCAAYAAGPLKNQGFASDGPYSIVRNPDYWFGLISATGIGLVSEKFGCLLVVALFFAVLYPLAVIGEERRKLAAGGENYARYAASTPRFLPNFAAYQDAGGRGFSPRAFASLLWPAFSAVPGLVLVLLVKFLERQWI
jgi:protein-S-isoprenylcysteine O-methyltransferase Ste14